jgi:hypothetical protein
MLLQLNIPITIVTGMVMDMDMGVIIVILKSKGEIIKLKRFLMKSMPKF